MWLDVAFVSPGVFFDDPGPLPRGRHALSRGDVVGAQRERLLKAVTELLAARGFEAVATADITRRAHVSLGAFYKHFQDKEDCVATAYGRFIETVHGRMMELERHENGRTAEDIVQKRLLTYFGTLEADRVVARAFQVEIDGAGPAIRSVRGKSLLQTAMALDARQEVVLRGEPGLRPLPPGSHLAIVHAARAVAAAALETGRPRDLRALVAPSLKFVMAVYRGAGRGPEGPRD